MGSILGDVSKVAVSQLVQAATKLPKCYCVHKALQPAAAPKPGFKEHQVHAVSQSNNWAALEMCLGSHTSPQSFPALTAPALRREGSISKLREL